MRKKVTPAIHFGGGETQAAEDGGDVGAVLDAVVDGLDEKCTGLVIEGVAVLLLVDDVGGRNALGGVKEGAGHLVGEGGKVGQGVSVMPLERWLGTVARQPAHVVSFSPNDVLQGFADGAVGAWPGRSQLVGGELLAGGKDLRVGLVVISDELDKNGFGWFSMLGISNLLPPTMCLTFTLAGTFDNPYYLAARG